MQTTAIRTVAKSLPQNKVILLTCLISNSYIPYTDLQKDFGKLHKAHQTHSSCKTYFVLVSTSSYIEDAKIERMENFMNLSVGLNKIFKLDYMGQMIYLHNRKRAIQPDFCVLSWEIK